MKPRRCFTRIWLGSDNDLMVTKGTRAVFLFQESIGDLHYDLIKVNGKLILDINDDVVVKFTSMRYDDM